MIRSQCRSRAQKFFFSFVRYRTENSGTECAIVVVGIPLFLYHASARCHLPFRVSADSGEVAAAEQRLCSWPSHHRWLRTLPGKQSDVVECELAKWRDTRNRGSDAHGASVRLACCQFGSAGFSRCCRGRRVSYREGSESNPWQPERSTANGGERRVSAHRRRQTRGPSRQRLRQ